MAEPKKKDVGKNVGKKTGKMPAGYDLAKAVRQERHYKSNINVRDKKVREYIGEEYGTVGPGKLRPGYLYMFDYKTPKYKEELDYYDAAPCSLVFNSIDTDDGPRILAFNFHMMPPRMRYYSLGRVLEIFRDVYKTAWSAPVGGNIRHFDYKLLLYLIQKSKLEFCCRMYIPKLMHNITPVPPEAWSKAVLTEGHFHKDTRKNILNYWKQWTPTPETRKNIAQGKSRYKNLKNR